MNEFELELLELLRLQNESINKQLLLLTDIKKAIAQQLTLTDVSKSFFCQHKLVLDCKEQCFKCKKS